MCSGNGKCQRSRESANTKKEKRKTASPLNLAKQNLSLIIVQLAKRLGKPIGTFEGESVLVCCSIDKPKPLTTNMYWEQRQQQKQKQQHIPKHFGVCVNVSQVAAV